MSDSNDVQRQQEEIPHDIGWEDIDLSPIAERTKQWNEAFTAGKIKEMCTKLRKKYVKEYLKVPRTESLRQIIAENRQKKFKEIQEKYAAELRRTGLGIETVPTWVSSKTTKDGEMHVLHGVFMIKNRRYFLSYLDMLIDHEGRTAEQANGVVEVINSLRNELIQNYDLWDPNSDPMIDLLAILPKIVQRLETLVSMHFFEGIDRKHEKILEGTLLDLRSFTFLLKQKCLREFLTAMQAHFATMNDLKNDDAGALTFAIDTHDEHVFFLLYPRNDSQQIYREKWERILSIIENMRTNPHACELARLFTERLQRILTCAKAELTGKVFPPAMYHRNETSIEELSIVIDEMYNRLTD